MCAAGFAAAHDRRTFRRTSQFTNALIVSGSQDCTARVWNATTGAVEMELKGLSSCLRSVGFSQDGSQVVSGSDDGTIWIWNAMTGGVEAK